MSDLSPRETVSELDRFIIGQTAAKRSVAVALRSRWRRRQLEEDMREEVHPKNILMVGPTGVGKTEIARRLARLAEAPFIKVEATRFTEVGYVGHDVESIIRDLVETAILQVRERRRKEVSAKVEKKAEDRLLDALLHDKNKTSEATREAVRRKLREGELDDGPVEVEMRDVSMPMASFDLPTGIGAATINIQEIFGNSMSSGRNRKRELTVGEARRQLVEEEADKRLDSDVITREAVNLVEQEGIVFLDEIDKLCGHAEVRGAQVSREGVQRDLLPLIEGTTVSTRHGTVNTDHVLFIASGAFHLAKPADLLPELQGRLPIRVQLSALTQKEFESILTETDFSLTRQCTAMLGTEGVNLEFTDEGVQEIARIAVEVNTAVENIGARRLHTVLEKLLEEVSFKAPDMDGKKVVVDAKFVNENLGDLARATDRERYIL